MASVWITFLYWVSMFIWMSAVPSEFTLTPPMLPTTTPEMFTVCP